jgi:hypothetical protein
MAAWPQTEVYASARGRIVCMDSLGYVDERNDVTDVIVGASHGAPCATQLVVGVRPRGVICHAAGVGKGEGGVAGLNLLDAYLIPGAAIDGMSARISDAVDMYENGIVSHVNASATRMGIAPGLPAKQAAMQMLERNPPPLPDARRQIVVHSSELGRVLALDTVKFADERIAGSVLCMGSHAARTMPRYLEALGVRLAGVITNDVGRAKDESGIAGLPLLDRVGLAAATVSCDSARVGDACSTYFDGVISAHNHTAALLGIAVGRTAIEAAEAMLRAARQGIRASR